MEESRTTDSREVSGRSTTTKLAPDATSTEPIESQTNDSIDAVNQTVPDSTDTTLQLTVIEGMQVGRGVARIDPGNIARLGCQPGDIVLITGARTTSAKVVPSAMV